VIKKSAALILTLLYLVTATGFAFDLHFCSDHVTSLKINAPAKNCAMLSKCKMKCCNNKHVEIKVKDARQGNSQSFRLKTFSFQLPKLHNGTVHIKGQTVLFV
jgi:hypothetical protein